MAIITDTIAARNRACSALNLLARHLAERGAKHISAKALPNGRLVWTVQSQTNSDKFYTVVLENDGWESTSCSCEDFAYRHSAECKHIKACRLLEGEVMEQPTVAEQRAARDAEVDAKLETQRQERRARRREWAEEV